MNYTLFIILVIILILYILSLIFYSTFSQKLFNKRFDEQNINQDISTLTESVGDDFKHIKNKTNFFTLVTIFIIITILLIYYIIKYGIIKGIWRIIITWVFFTIATPTPQSGLLLSIPLKLIFKIPMDLTQIIASMVCLIIIFGLHFFAPQALNIGMFGKIMDSVIKNNAYLILVSSSIGSTTISGLIDKIIDFFSLKKIQLDTVISYFILTIVSIIYYNEEMKKFNLYIYFNKN